MDKRTILITGANRGIGFAIAQGLAQNTNDTILLGCRNIPAGLRAAEQLGVHTDAMRLDLSHQDHVERDIRDILDEYPRIDVLINNAGVLHENSFMESGMAFFEDALQVNTLSPLCLIRAVLPEMIKNGYGRIVNMSSGWGSFRSGLTGPCTYSVSKAALNAITLTTSQQLPKNVKINSMCPGWVRTNMGGANATRSPEQGAETAIWLANLDADGPTGGFFRDKHLIDW